MDRFPPTPDRDTRSGTRTQGTQAGVVDFSRSLNNDAPTPRFYRLMKPKADQKLQKYFEQIS